MTNQVSAELRRFNQAAENNKEPIARQLGQLLAPGARVLEIGSGSGQHALYFSGQLPEVSWQTSDTEPYLVDLRANLAEQEQLSPPLEIDIDRFPQTGTYDAVFCANVLHIAPAALITKFMVGVSGSLAEGGVLILYGPYKYEGKFTTTSNASFDVWLKERNPASGIRDFEYVRDEAANNGLECVKDVSMPANNQMLIFRKIER